MPRPKLKVKKRKPVLSCVPKYSNNKETSDSQVEVSDPNVLQPRLSVSEPRPMSTKTERS